ncbi:MAG: hypothetical protein BAJALOKI1v1_970009 [Promethearchaeota archaeon]|nr:MAG: hypothetical protein BAJALOKI1v1_970009 [Candidatus Lokiarchaeota archaeon]
MTKTCYIIDSSSLIELNKHNPMDIYQTPWKRIEGLIKNKRILAPKEVLNEINDYDDALAAWGKQHPGMFIEETAEQIKIVKEILKKYPSLIKKDKKHAADPWVIALAIEMIHDPQQTLVEIKRIVVTEEKLRGNKVRIPYVCQDYTIESIDILDMFRMEGWKF